MPTTTLPLIPQLSEERLLTLIDMLPDDELADIEQAYGFAGCDCMLENEESHHALYRALKIAIDLELPDTCPEVRFLAGVYGPCCDHTRRVGYVLPPRAYQAILERLYPVTLGEEGFDGVGELPEPPAPFSVNDPSGIVAVRQSRYDSGFAIRHRDDQASLSERSGRAVDRDKRSGAIILGKVIDHAPSTAHAQPAQRSGPS